MTDTDDIHCFCLFVRSGSEQTVADTLVKAREEQGIKVVAPRRFMQEKREGRWRKRALALLPGYVFVYGDLAPEDLRKLRTDNVYKLLKYDNDLRELLGDDREYALWILRNHGDIGMSKVLDVGGDIRVVSGPLMDCIGKIIRLDKHKRRATVQFDFDGRLRTVTLAAEVVTGHESYEGAK